MTARSALALLVISGHTLLTRHLGLGAPVPFHARGGDLDVAGGPAHGSLAVLPRPRGTELPQTPVDQRSDPVEEVRFTRVAGFDVRRYTNVSVAAPL